MKTQPFRFTFRKKCHKENTILKTDRLSSSGRKSSSELFTHNLTSTHMKQARQSSRFPRLNSLLVCCAFVVLMGVMALGVADIVHAQVTFVTNLGQPYTWVHKERRVNDLGSSTEITTHVPYAIWVDGGLAQMFRTGSNEFGYNVSSVEIRIGKADRDLMTIPSSVSLWSSDSSGDPESLLYTFTPLADSLPVGFNEASIKFESNAILESNTNYLIVITSTEQSRITVTSSSDDDPGASLGWSIHRTARKRKGDIWKIAVRSDVGNAIFPTHTAPRIRIKFEGTVLNSQTIIISLTNVGDGQFKATATTSAPSDIVLPITIINGVGATTVTIPASSTESDVISVSRTPGTTFPVSVDIGNLPSPPPGYTLFKSPSRLPLQVLDGLSGGPTPVSERTPLVRDAIVAAVPSANSANDVTEAHLAAITTLRVNHPSGTALSSRPIEFQMDDFAGLTALTTLEIGWHASIILPDGIFTGLVSLRELSLYHLGSLTSVPNAVLSLTSLTSLNLGFTGLSSLLDGVFDNLTQLTSLDLSGNDLTSLPTGVFDNLTSLIYLNLEYNDLASLPDGVFDNLTSLTRLNLDGLELTSLPDGVFDRLTSLMRLSMRDSLLSSLSGDDFSGLPGLTYLNLSGNRWTSLPAGIFSGLSSLTSLHLERNSVDPLPLTVSLEKVGEGQFKAVAPTGAPFDIVLPLRIRNGSINAGTNTLMIPKGRVESTSRTVTRTPGTTAAVTADIGTLPGLPTGVNSFGASLHQGYTLVKSTDLPIFVISRLASGITPVSERTPQVRDAIVAAVPGINSANDVTEAHLAAITALDLNNRNITTLKVGDFDGLTGLEELRLYNNQLTILPEDIFDGLIALTTLRLYGNQLSSLPEDIFDELIALTTLQLGLNQFTTLPGTIFDGLTKLTDLRMIGNQFTTLPEGIFEGLTGLTTLYLGSNAVSPLPLTVSLEKVGDNQFKAAAPSGAPFDIVLPLSIANGTIYSGATTITIPAGELESEPLTVLRTSDRTSTVTVNIGTLPGLPANHSGYALAKSNNLPLTFTNLGPVFTPVRDRTPQVRDQITLLVRAKFRDVNSVNDVTAAHLRSITTSLDLRNKSITSLKAGDFSGLSSLEKLILDQNSISSLPEEVFEGLSALKELWIQANALTSLPAGVFDGLSRLEKLQLASNALTSLPEDVFDGLSNLTTLDLHNNSLSSLPEDVFDGLSSLTLIRLTSNALTSLPEDVFDGLSNLTTLNLHNNSLNSLPEEVFDGLSALTTLNLSSNALTSLPMGVFVGLSNLTSLSMHSNSASLFVTVSLQKVGEDQFKAVAPTGAPFDIVLPLSVANGSVTGGATTITIPAGSVESELLAVTRTPSTTAVVTVDIGTLPGRPSGHFDYRLVKSDALPLEVISSDVTATATGTVTIPDPNLRAKIETALGKTSGDPISPAEMATLTSLSAQDAGIRNLTGLETATNLTSLHLGNNSVSDISVVAGLTKLTELQLWDNTITNISAVAGLTNLTKLYLWGNTISDISPMARLTNLTRLYLGENSVSSILAVAGLTNLTHLYLNENSVTDISSIAGLTHLTELRIGDNTISDIDAVTNLTSLVWLDMPNNTISDISPVENLTDLAELYFQNNTVSDLSPLVANTGLGANAEIDVRDNPLSYPSIYTHIPNLQARDVFIDFDNRTPTTPLKISGDTQQGVPGTALAQPFIVEVQDGDNVAFAGVPVTFAVTAGGGTLSVTSTTTGANGRAQSTLTLGSSAGTNTVRASVQGISASVTFTAEATTTNSAPVFTDGTNTTRTVVENTAAAQNIGSAIAAADADNDTLTYTLSGTDAAAFNIEPTTGQLRTRAALDYETQRSYTVTVSVSDGSLTDTITVTINVSDIAETPMNVAVCQAGDILAPGESCTYPGTDATFSVLSDGRGQFLFFTGGTGLNIKDTVINGQSYTLVAQKLASGSWEIEEIADSAAPATTNTAPTFTEGANTTRTIAENTSGDVNIGAAVAATDPENDTLTYTLSGIDAASFNIESTTGQLKTSTALDYETKATYTVTITVSDSDLTDTITVTINVSDIAETSTATTAVDIPDSNLRAKIETALGKASGDPISAAEMATLTSLSAQDAGISNLTGLETATNLTTLLLGNNSISNISAIAGLTKLTELQLWDNTISNISAVAGLTQLTRLYLWGNIITDISHISGLTNLTHLRLGENSVSNISAVAGLTNLTHLNLKENSISNISAVAGLTNLTELVIGNNTISDIAPVANLTKLVWLDMPNNTISDITPVTGLTNLIELYFEENSVSDISPLTVNTGLGNNTEVDVRGNPLNYPSIYTHIPALQARGAYVDFDNRVATAPVKISGDTQQGNTSATLAQPFVVEARDGDSAAFARVPVTFAVTAGGGILSVTSTTTNANGRAESTLTLGNTAATNTVRVSVQGISQTAIFTAVATTTNTAPTFTEGASTARTVAENTATGVNIGNAIAATDANNDTLTYTLSGTDAASFSIESTTGQLKPSAVLDYETKSTYTVTVTVSDGNLTDTIIVTINVTINVTDIAETPANTGVCQAGDVLTPGESCTYPGTDTEFSVHNNGNGQFLFFTSSSNLNIKNTVINGQSYTLVTQKLASGSWEIEAIADSTAPATPNTAPTFTEGVSTTRSIAENVATGVNIGTAIAATDADNDALTYTLGGTDASAFDIDSTTGQLRTRVTLDYETKSTYTVTVTVSDGSLTNTITVTITVTDVNDTAVVSTLTPVCDRTTQVRDAIVAAVPGVSDCDDVTDAHLAAIRGLLDLRNKNISALKPGDFDGLSSLQDIRLDRNQLRALPADIFSGLSSLRTLYLGDNQLTSLPADVFSGLSALTDLFLHENRLASLPVDLFAGLSALRQINLHTNRLTTLPANVFSGLSSLTQIYLRNNRLTSLPADVFSGLSSLQYLYLDGNRLTSLPSDLFSELSSLTQLLLNNNQMSTLSVGMFRGLTASTWIWLQGNTVDPLPLTVSLEKTGVNQFKATVPAGAPFTIVLPLRVVNGSISGGANTLTIPQGNVESGRLTVTRTAGTTAAVTVDIGTLPGLPTNHQGYQLAKSTNLPLEIFSSPANRAPVFTEGASTIRSVAENTAPSVNIGAGITATDPDNDTLTYTLSGTDAASFRINSSTGQLQTKSALDYETKTVYTVTITVSDGSLTDTITVTISVTDINELPTNTGICKVGDILALGESCTYPGTDATFSVLDNGSSQWNIPDLPAWLAWANQVSIGGSLSFSATINDDNYHFVAEEVPNDSWEIKEIGDSGSQQPDPPEEPEEPEEPGNVGGTPTLNASTAAPLTEATLDGNVVTLRVTGGIYKDNWNFVNRNVKVSGIAGVTFSPFNLDIESGTEITVELDFNGTDFDANSTLTFTVEPEAMVNYTGPALTAQISVTALTESVVATTAAPLTEATLDESVVTLTLSGRTYERSIFTIRDAVTVSGIEGVSIPWHQPDRESDTEVTVELEFDGNIDTDSTLTFTVGSDAIVGGYNGSALTAQVSVSASTEAPVVTDGQTPVTPQQPDNTGGTPTLSVTTAAPLTEATLHESVVTLILSGRVYEDSSYTVALAITVSGIDGATFETWDVDRISDTEVTVELTFDGDFDTDATLTVTVEAGAIAGYSGPALTAQISVTGGPESIVASTTAPLTEATLHESVVTLTLSGRVYEDSSYTVARAITVSGIDGATFETWDVDRISDTEVTVELTFNGDFDTDATLTFTVEAGAIAGYGGSAFTAHIPVTGGTESLVASTAAPLTEATLHESVVTLTLSGRVYEDSSYTVARAITVSGIDGATFETWDVDRISDTKVTVELEFDGNIDTDAALTFTVGADAIAGYNGPALTAQVPVTATEQVLRAPSGISLIHVPLKVTAVDGVPKTIESVGALYDALGGVNTVNLLITHNPKTQEWRSYLGDSSRGTSADTVLTDNQGIIADMKTPVSLQLDGNALGRNGSSVITLHPGTNLVAMPLSDSRITRVSDLLALEGIGGNVSAITVSNNGSFQTVEQAGDAGDIPITGGQSFILNAWEETTVAISGQGWDNVSGAAAAAPGALTGIEVGDATPVLALRGSIVSPVGGWGRIPHLRSESGFHVIVKNLSTGSAVATVIGDTGDSYQLTVVDTETGQAAQIGDILEISVRSPNPLIGVQPLRYTVTAEDVRRSRIQLPELTVYEIPAETELLRNYPNPFNPETWIPYRLAEDAFVTLTIYDTAGRVVRSIDVGYKPAAVYESRSKAVYWDGRNEFGEGVASGVYFYHLSAGDFSATRKMLILK